MAVLDKQNSINIFKEVSAQSRIVDVVSYYLGPSNLQRKGKIYLAICPFHHDTHPSMRVDPERNTYKCFACGAGGDSIKFAMEYGKLSAFDAMKKVAEICQITLPDQIKTFVHTDNLSSRYPQELNAMTELRKYYQLCLESLDGKPCKDYLNKRGLTSEIISHFELGYAPDNSKDAIDKLRSRGFDIPTLTRCGILSGSSEFADRYVHRLMFPIEDNFGHLVAFSGRMIEKGQEGGKYINSPETALFKKNSVLYHFSKAKDDARRKGYIYVVEGFMDVIAVVSSGTYAVCALMGTALTKEHAQAFKHLGVEVRLCLDADEPGQIGEERAARVLLENEVPFRVVRKFKQAKDADEVLHTFGAKELDNLLQNLLDPYLFFLARKLRGRNMLTDSQEILSFLREAAPYYALLDLVSKDKDLQITQRVCSLNAQTITSILNTSKSFAASSTSSTSSSETNNKVFTASTSKYSKPWRRRNTDSIDPKVKNIELGGKYQLCDILSSLHDYILSVSDLDNYGKRILETECDILFMLPHSFDAYSIVEDSRLSFSYPPFYRLAIFIGDEYLEHPGNKLPFTDVDYESLKNKVLRMTKGSQRIEDSPLDLDDLDLGDDLYEDEDENPCEQIEKDESLFLINFIDRMRQVPSEFYDARSFKNLVILHPLYIQYNQLLKKKKAGELTDKEKSQLIRTIVEIKRNNGVV